MLSLFFFFSWGWFLLTFPFESFGFVFAFVLCLFWTSWFSILWILFKLLLGDTFLSFYSFHPYDQTHNHLVIFLFFTNYKLELPFEKLTNFWFDCKFIRNSKCLKPSLKVFNSLIHRFYSAMIFTLSNSFFKFIIINGF